MGTLKSGWLEKQGGGIFWKDWKRRHCVLYRDGELSIYEKTTNATAELRINMRLDCKRIDVGFDCGGTINLPKGRGDVEALFAIVGKHKTHIFLAPSESECRQWVGILENTRTSAAPPSKKVPMAPAQENIPPPAYAPMEYSQPLGAGSTAPPPPGVVPHGQPAYQPAPPAPGYYPQQGYGQPSYGQPMYGQPMYGQPMYGQPVYVSQAPQQQPQGR